MQEKGGVAVILRPGERVRHGRRTPGFRAKQDSESEERLESKEAVVPGWVSREQASVRWTLASANGLATDGKPRTCKREHGERSAASLLIHYRRLGETIVRYPTDS